MLPEDPILDSIRKGKTKAVELWIKEGNNVNDYIYTYDINLFTFVLFTEHENIIEAFLKAGAIFEYRGLSAYWIPIQQNNLRVVEILFQNNIDINSLDYQENTPLHHALALRRSAIGTFLIKNKANQDLPNKEGITASALKAFSPQNNTFHEFNEINVNLALFLGETALFKKWVNEGKDLNPFQNAFLCRTATYGHVELLRFFISLNFNVNSKSKDGETALHSLPAMEARNERGW